MIVTTRLKRAVKHLLLPVIRRLTRGLDARVEAIEHGWHHYLPSFLSAVSSVGAFGHELFDLRRNLEREIAVLRGEVEALARRIDGAGVTDGATPLRPWIASSEKIAEARRAGTRLNLDGGECPRAGFVNVGRQVLPTTDIVADPGDVPLDAASVMEIYSARLLDRVPQEELRRRLLPYWHSLLTPGGHFRAVVRDASATVAALAAGRCSFEEFRTALIEPSDGHFCGNLFTPDSLNRLLQDTGFVNIRVAPAGGDPSPPQLEVVAERPSR